MLVFIEKSRNALFDDTPLALLCLRYATAGLVLLAVLINLLYRSLQTLGASVSGFGVVVEEDEKSVDKKSKKKKVKAVGTSTASDEDHDAKKERPPRRPRRALLLVPLFLVAVTHLADASVLVAHAVIIRSGLVDELFFWPSLVSLLAFWIAAVVLALDKSDDATESVSIAVVTGISVVSQTIILALHFRVALAYSHTADTTSSTLEITSLITDAIRLVLFFILASAYLYRFQESAQSAKAIDDVDEESEALLAESEPSDEDIIEADSDAEDEEAEQEEKKKQKSYGPIATLRRIRRLLPYIVPIKSRSVILLAAVCIALVFAQNVCNLLVPRQMGKIINDFTEGRSPWRNIFIWSVLRSLSGWRSLLSLLQSILWLPIGQRAKRELSIMSFAHVLDLSARYHQDKRTGEVISVLARSGSAANFLQTALFDIAPLFIDIAATLFYLTAVWGATISAVAITTGITYLAIFAYTRKREIQLTTELNDASDGLEAIKNESISNVDLVKYFSAERYEVGRYTKSILKRQKMSFTYACYDGVGDMVKSMSMTIGTLLGALLVARQIARGEQTIGSFVAFLDYMGGLLSRVNNIAWMGQWFTSLMTSTDKLMDILDEETDLKDAPDAEEIYGCKGEIEFDNVTFTYPAKGKSKKEPRKALKGISFKVKPGQHVALVGQTGSGKSTVFKLLFRFFDVDEGSITVDGKDIRKLTQHSLRRALGVVQQEGALFNDTILANIKYGDVTAEDSKVIEAAKAAQIHQRVLEWPKKYHTIVGERGVKLSGGEKQRVSIARTILKNPDVLLLDEATSALDTKTEKEIQAQLRKLTQNKTTIAIAHRLSTIAHADLILVLNDGEIVEAGNQEELLKIEDGHYKKLWNAQIATGAQATDEDSSIAGNSEIVLPSEV